MMLSTAPTISGVAVARDPSEGLIAIDGYCIQCETERQGMLNTYEIGIKSHIGKGVKMRREAKCPKCQSVIMRHEWYERLEHGVVPSAPPREGTIAVGTKVVLKWSGKPGVSQEADGREGTVDKLGAKRYRVVYDGLPISGMKHCYALPEQVRVKRTDADFMANLTGPDSIE